MVFTSKKNQNLESESDLGYCWQGARHAEPWLPVTDNPRVRSICLCPNLDIIANDIGKILVLFISNEYIDSCCDLDAGSLFIF